MADHGVVRCSAQSSDFTLEYLVRYTILTQQGSIKVVVISPQMMSVFGMEYFFVRALENINQESKSWSDLNALLSWWTGTVLPRSLKVFYENNMDI